VVALPEGDGSGELHAHNATAHIARARIYPPQWSDH
jgi:hypothetical protein